MFQKNRSSRFALLTAAGVATAGFACGSASASILTITDGAFTPDQDPVRNTAIVNSYTTSAGTVSTLAGASSITGTFETSGSYGPSTIRNVWGLDGTEVDGTPSVVGLDAAVGLANATQVNAQFGLEITGAVGNANDFFILEVTGNDAITVVPLDASGNPIGDFSLSITTGGWGDVVGYGFRGNSINPNSTTIGGVAFDLEDFIGTGTLTGVTGLRTSGSLDALVIGYNTAAAIPEPASLALLGLGGLCLLGRRRSA